jgi:UDP-N-acetylmuramoyl-tripeptide--D-alanyl-D-alanine ligase
VLVEDTFRGLEHLGVAARERAPQARRGAVTGSVGKTSVTRAVEAGLRLAGKAHASVKSYNNHIGVPLTLARMPRDTERAVFEVGMNHADEIVPLSRIHPSARGGHHHRRPGPPGELRRRRGGRRPRQGRDLRRPGAGASPC